MNFVTRELSTRIACGQSPARSSHEGGAVIGWRLILEAAAITGLAVALAAGLARWPARTALVATAGAFAVVVAWRAVGNEASLNEDFVHLISVADCGCLIAGALVPGVMAARVSLATWRRALPVVIGGLVGFVINVVIL